MQNFQKLFVRKNGTILIKHAINISLAATFRKKINLDVKMSLYDRK